MKKLILLAALPLLFATCTKDNITPNPPNTNPGQTVYYGYIRFDNYSNNPYKVWANGAYKGIVNGYGKLTVKTETGSYSLRALQESGYVMYPTEVNATGTVTHNGTLVFKFP